VVKGKHPGRAGEFSHQILDLRIVNSSYFMVIVKILHPGLAVDQPKAVLIQRKAIS
jgi:hypothetical protein